MITIVLGVGIYFIVADAINKKTNDCLIKYFNDKGFLKAYNITLDMDPSSIKYLNEDCSSIIDIAHQKTSMKIGSMNLTDCEVSVFRKQPAMDNIMLYIILQKRGHDSYPIYKKTYAGASAICNNGTQTSTTN